MKTTTRRLSDIYGFDGKGIDFVDLDLDDDLILYVDPLLMWRSPNREHHIAHSKLINFFSESIDLVKAGKSAQAKSRFVFHEPENLLGQSKKGHRGHGMGQILGERVFNGIVKNKDIMDNGLNFLNELQLVIQDVGPDLISDMTVDLTKDYFIKYTQTQCEKYKIPMEETTTDIFIDAENRWDQIRVLLPRIPDTETFFILTPKILVRKSDIALNYKEVYKEHLRDIYKMRMVSDFSALGQEPKVNWKDVEREYPVTKNNVTDALSSMPRLRDEIVNSVPRDIGARGLEVTSNLFKELNPNGQVSSDALRDIFSSIRKDEGLKSDIEKILDSNPTRQLFLIDELNGLIQKTSEDLVVVLGSYNLEQKDPFAECKNFLENEDYEPCIIKDMPDIAHVNPRQKLFPYAALSRFLVVLDFGPSGHLSEIELLKDLTKPVIIISKDKKGSTYMTHGIEVTHPFFKRFTLEECQSIEACLEQGTDWANSKISELQRINNEELPWQKVHSAEV